MEIFDSYVQIKYLQRSDRALKNVRCVFTLRPDWLELNPLFARNFQSRDLILIGHLIGTHHLPVNIWPQVVFMIKKKWFYVRVLAIGRGRDKGINMARIPSIITSRGEETFYGWVCDKHFISGKAAKLWERYDPDWVLTQNLGGQKCGSVEELQVDLEVATKRDERARGRDLKRVAGERERQLREEIESKKQKLDKPGEKVIDISFDVESAVGTKLSKTGFVLHLLRSK